jgi:cbb3-type cytochrome oxidase cytochrome c subunit
VNVRDFDGQKNFVSETDALVAYLQTLGTLADINDYQLQQEGAK